MKFDEIVSTVRDTLSVRRVFAEPIEKDGVVVVPAANVRGSMGGGHGRDENGQEGSGGGGILMARPAGVYVIKDRDVQWIPAIDVSRLIMVAGVVIVAFLFARSRIVKARTKASVKETAIKSATGQR